MTTATLTRSDALWRFDRTGGQDRPEILDREDIDPEPISTDDCPDYPDDVCSVCEEPATWVVIDPCPTGCCDRPVCLDCASRAGLDIT